jgi:superfamily II DNA or RNA helicase
MFRAPINHFRQNQNLKTLGVTATPDRTDEKLLGQVFGPAAYDYVLWDAVMDGWLVPLKHWAKQLVGLDLSKVKTVAGELNGADLAREIAANQNLEAIAAATVECAGNRQTLIFADSVENAETLTVIFNGHKRGEARLLVGVTPDDERDEIIADYRAGRFQYLINVGVCTEGFDVPNIGCISLARPTKSRSLCAQMIGRGTRPSESIADALNDYPNDLARRAAIAASNKPDLLVIDFVDNTHRHDLVHPANILGGRICERAVELANRAAENGKPVDIIEQLETSEREIRRNDELLNAAKDRAGVQARTRQGSDPFSVYGLSRRERRGWESETPMTDAQRAKIEKWKIKKAENLTESEAQQIVEEVQRRARMGLLTLNQDRVLRRYGYQTEHMTFEQAHRSMDELAANNWQRPKVKP